MLCSAILFTTVLLSQTRSALIAIIAGLLIFFINEKRKMLVLLALIFGIVLFTPIKERFIRIYNRDGQNVRLAQNALSYEIFKDYPILGTGFGIQTYRKLDLKKYKRQLPAKYKNYKRRPFNYPHNMYFSILTRIGMVGFLLCGYLYFVFCKLCFQNYRSPDNASSKKRILVLFSSLSGIMIIGFFEPTFQHMAEQVIFTILALTTVICDSKFNLSNSALSTNDSTLQI